MNVIQFDTIASMRATSGTTHDQCAILENYHSPESSTSPADGGGGIFWWTPDTTTADNGGTVIAKSSGRIGAWKRIYSDPVNVKWFGAKGDGRADDTTAIMATFKAVARSANGGTIIFPVGTYLVSSSDPTVPCLQFANAPVNLVGAGGRDPQVGPSATTIKSTGNGPIVSFLSTTDAQLGHLSTLRDIAIAGSGVSDGTQHGLIVDNEGIVAENVYVLNCGGDGIQLRSSVSGVYTNGVTSGNKRHGWNLVPGLSQNPMIGGIPVTNNSFVGCSGLGNGGDGFHMECSPNAEVVGNVWIGGDVEGNGGYGVNMINVNGGAQTVRWNLFYGLWEEQNSKGSWHVDASGNVHSNEIRFARFGPAPTFDAAFVDNVWSGPDASSYRQMIGLSAVQSFGRFNSSDIDYIPFVNNDGTADAQLRCGSLASTFGITTTSAASPKNIFAPTTSVVPTLAIPQFTDAVCVPSGQGMRAATHANTGTSPWPDVGLIKHSWDGERDCVDVGYSGTGGGTAPMRLNNTGTTPAGMWSGTGAPNSLNNDTGVPGSAIGDLYIRADGGTSTTIYRKTGQPNTWTGIL